ncbi:Hypothetical protein POVR2_LOCUS386 [uncultured virus]|nr:Hypothetical protein POVR2_LOCUS386 [uncultured virus]
MNLSDAPAYYDVMNRLDVPSVELPVELADLVNRVCRVPREVRSQSIEIYSDRPFFVLRPLFYHTTCQVGNKHVFSRTSCDNKVADAIYISAVDVYDRYGIRIAHTFLYRLLTLVKIHDIEAIALYLVGSLAVLDEHDLYVKLLERRSVKHREDNLLQTINKSCHKLLEVFRDIEAMYPACNSIEQLDAQYQLPVELLAIIFKSARINKSTRQVYLASRQARELREGEMAIRACYPSVSRVEDSYISDFDEVTICNGYHFSRVLIPQLVRPIEVTYSWKDMAMISDKSEIETFEALTSDLDLTDGRKLCILVLLLQHTEPTISIVTEMKTLSHAELVDLYLRLRDHYLTSVASLPACNKKAYESDLVSISTL